MQAGPISSDSSGRASARAFMSPTTGVACRRANAACCSRASLMELISGEGREERGEDGGGERGGWRGRGGEGRKKLFTEERMRGRQREGE